MFFVFMICAMFSVDSLKKIAYDFGGINENETNNSYHESLFIFKRFFVEVLFLRDSHWVKARLLPSTSCS